MKVLHCVLAWTRKVLCLVAVLVAIREPGRFVELGTSLLSWPTGAAAYVLLTGWGAHLCARLWFGLVPARTKEGMACSGILCLAILLMASAPAMYACHCVTWNFAQAFSPYWRHLCVAGAWLMVEGLLWLCPGSEAGKDAVDECKEIVEEGEWRTNREE